MTSKKLMRRHQRISARASGGDTNTDVRIVHNFSIPLPPKPSPSSKLVTQTTDLPFGGVIPKIAGPLETADGKPFIEVIIDLRNAPNCVPCVTYGTHIAAAWADPPQPNTYHHLRIQVQSIAKGHSS